MTAQLRTTRPIERPTLAAMITERLRESIINGTLQPGTWVGEPELAHSFDAKQVPVFDEAVVTIKSGDEQTPEEEPA